MASTTIEIPMNRVEGDLEVRAQIEDGVVSDAWCSGTMYRGFERIMLGRGALDGLVITPRVCGICSTSHLTAAVRALDAISSAFVPPDALRLRNIALMAEHIQSDVRQTFLMFTPDLINPAYRDCSLYEEASKRYAPFKGSAVIDTLRQTKHVLEIVAIIGGQWPHSSFMLPGGVASVPSAADMLQCRMLLKNYRRWYEERILGCSVERWMGVHSSSELDSWLDEKPAHRDSELGFFIRYARALGLDRIGHGHGKFVTFGSLQLPEGTKLRVPAGATFLTPPGFGKAHRLERLDPSKISEHLGFSWFAEAGVPSAHPFEGSTLPYATGDEGKKYSWVKAPRYDGAPAETGPLAEAITAEHPLFTDLVGARGPSAFVRQLARLVRPAEMMPAMEAWMAETDTSAKLYEPQGKIESGEGFGMLQATRGALGHWVRIEDGIIRHYQIITPTGWNASPRDNDGVRGPIEEALVGVSVKDPADPVELAHVVRSFDPCLVCSVHAIDASRSRGRWSP